MKSPHNPTHTYFERKQDSMSYETSKSRLALLKDAEQQCAEREARALSRLNAARSAYEEAQVAHAEVSSRLSDLQAQHDVATTAVN